MSAPTNAPSIAADIEAHWRVLNEWEWPARFRYVSRLGDIWRQRLEADDRRRVGLGWGELAWVMYYEVGDYAQAAQFVSDGTEKGNPPN